MQPEIHHVTLQIGRTGVRLQTKDPGFGQMLKRRYKGFVKPRAHADFDFAVELAAPDLRHIDKDLVVQQQRGRWIVERGDFWASWDNRTNRGRIRQSANPYSVDTLLRILHSLVLAREGGFLLHAASAVRNGRAFLFCGVSGAGKTTLTRLAPPDVTVLTDEISYICKEGAVYRAFGTPFAGELARVGANICAPIEALFLLKKGSENKLERMEKTEAVQALLRNILFLSRDEHLVERLFGSAIEFILAVPVWRMVFTPDARAWELVS
jgi:hypothetical protein